jgi:hypothetical protein
LFGDTNFHLGFGERVVLGMAVVVVNAVVEVLWWGVPPVGAGGFWVEF